MTGSGAPGFCFEIDGLVAGVEDVWSQSLSMIAGSGRSLETYITLELAKKGHDDDGETEDPMRSSGPDQA